MIVRRGGETRRKRYAQNGEVVRFVELARPRLAQSLRHCPGIGHRARQDLVHMLMAWIAYDSLPAIFDEALKVEHGTPPSVGSPVNEGAELPSEGTRPQPGV